jgi:hypothetical protein
MLKEMIITSLVCLYFGIMVGLLATDGDTHKAVNQAISCMSEEYNLHSDGSAVCFFAVTGIDRSTYNNGKK